ncbi:MAG: S8 family peptidase [Rhodoferax sp.]
MKLLPISLAVAALLSAGPLSAQSLAGIPPVAGPSAARPLPLQSVSTLVAASPTAQELRSRNYQPWLDQIKKPYANQLDTGNGAGVTIGVVDSGVQVDHPELLGKVVRSYNAIDGSTTVTDQLGHGTHVSGILAGQLQNGSPFEGVAPGASLAMAKVFSTGGADGTTISRGIDWVVNTVQAPIVSMSLGGPSAFAESSMRNAVAKGTLVTIAMGNDGRSKAAWPAEFAKQSWAKGQLIAVGALDASNVRASFSNYDASLAQWTVFAPGVDITSSYSVPGGTNDYASMSGTSMATPMVAGEAALIKSNWNFLTAANLAKIIFQSSTHLCSDRVNATVCGARTTADKVYGWGLINVAASLEPLGTLTLNGGSGQTLSLAGTQFASPKSGTPAALSGLTSLATDSYNRGFKVRVGATVASAPAATAVSLIPVNSTVRVQTASSLFSLDGADQDMALDDERGSSAGWHRLRVRWSDEAGRTFGLGTQCSAAEFFGLDANGMTPLRLSGQERLFSVPYLHLMPQALHSGFGYPLSPQWTVRTGWLWQAAGTADGSATATSPLDAVQAKSMALVELQQQSAHTVWVLSLGQLHEQQSVLGANGTGALALNASPSTRFVTLASSHQWSAQTAVSAMLSWGVTDAYQNAGVSLIDGADQATSLAWSLGLRHSDVWRSGDQIGLSLAMPARTVGGQMRVTTASSQDADDGSLQYTQQSLDLAPSGMERRLELSYTRPVGSAASLGATARLTLEPNHDASAPAQTALGIRYTTRF